MRSLSMTIMFMHPSTPLQLLLHPPVLLLAYLSPRIPLLEDFEGGFLSRRFALPQNDVYNQKKNPEHRNYDEDEPQQPVHSPFLCILIHEIGQNQPRNPPY
ncbi:predicted coding region AF_0151 [Archaeoglobus fulgidus DSM 4304]|uniref:Uncharacterized protein AF_0151 n=1 Tax=Archaeoglobus fulgidus (strain ATCC 49558 / DSM 4304 / JCM 9628 / NBRC 100126 / VC-16) TaxID=224325 RepID=Y151_ARCFU|nr:RecName: Full=Uncharacterized protein AF_0151 [Archaeoglobus fulgidus DSM 4304]AAB91086.1 predicted coding region AF_0151 [Archaeoglobus fulgidus DSM 4304]